MIEAAPLAVARHRYPVLLFKSGIGAFALDYSTIAQDLASHGYVVVGSDTPHSTTVTAYADGSIATRTGKGHPSPARPADFEPLVALWAADTSYELDQLARLDKGPSGLFAGRLDLAHVGALGHSFGGASAAEFCRIDQRCKAAANIDGRLFGAVATRGLSKPLFLLLSDHRQERDPDATLVMAQFRRFWAILPPSRRLVVIPGSRHFNFSDNALRWNWLVGRLSQATGPIDRRLALTLTARELESFFAPLLGRDQSDPARTGLPPAKAGELRQVNHGG